VIPSWFYPVFLQHFRIFWRANVVEWAFAAHEFDPLTLALAMDFDSLYLFLSVLFGGIVVHFWHNCRQMLIIIIIL
jgi:hypothetical protein